MRAPLLLVCLVAAVLSGCGLGPGRERSGGVELRVTRDFGQDRIGSARAAELREDETVMRLLRSRFDVGTRYGGRFVQSINGIAGGGASGRRDWFYFVNGVEADVGAADYALDPGEVVQWDYRRWDGASRVPAIVGAYPEPLVHGVKGRIRPVRVECERAASRACGEVKQRLRRSGVRVSGASLGTSATENVIRVVVARWKLAQRIRAVASLAGGPRRSGVFARFRSGALELLGPDGRVARRAGSESGLLAAFAPSETELAWLVTGLGEAGVERAARALDARSLRDAYAVAAGPDGVEPLPLEARR